MSTPPHPPGCGCCGNNAPLGQSLDEVAFGTSACHLARVGDLRGLERRFAKARDVDAFLHGDGAGGSSGYTPLHYACRAGHVEVCRWLLARGARVGAATTAGSSTPLHRAAFAGHPAVVEALLSAGADSSARDADGHTAADRARAAGHTDLAASLDGAAGGGLPAP